MTLVKAKFGESQTYCSTRLKSMGDESCYCFLIIFQVNRQAIVEKQHEIFGTAMGDI